MTPDWLTVTTGAAPLVVSLPHTGTQLPADLEARLVSPWLARKDTDWWVDRLYDMARDLDATVVHTAMSRTVVDVNRDPSGDSLYPGQATTGLCPIETFDGEPLYTAGQEPTPREVAERRRAWFVPYHAALGAELDRLTTWHRRIVLYDCHSIRSVIPRLFAGELPQFNLGTNGGASCDPSLARALEQVTAATALSRVTNGRFTGGYITRHYGRPDGGVHAVQMELACRGYMDEPSVIGPDSWPTAYDEGRARAMKTTLTRLLETALAWAAEVPGAGASGRDTP